MIGQYTNSVGWDAWFTAPVKEKGKKRSKSIRPVLYAIFADMAKSLTDNFWVLLFNEASFGKLPKGFYVSKDAFLIHRKGKYSHTFSIDNVYPYSITAPLDPIYVPQLASLCVKFFQAYGLMSDEDKLNARKFFDSSAAVEKWNGWKDVSKNMRSVLIHEYVERSSKTFALSRAEAGDMLLTINIGVCLRAFGNTTIIMEDERIKLINGLLFNQNRKFSIGEGCIPALKMLINETNESMERYPYYDSWGERVVEIVKGGNIWPIPE